MDPARDYKENKSAPTTFELGIRSGRRLKFQLRLALLAFFCGLPAVAVCTLLLWIADFSARVQWTVDLLLTAAWLITSFHLNQHVIRPLQTLANMLSALREGDYSIRARRAVSGDALGEVMLEVNELGQTLRQQRLGALEATALLHTVMSEIDAAIFAFDERRTLRLVNRAGERLMGRAAKQLLGRTADELGLADCLARESDGTQILQKAFPRGIGRWGVRRSSFRQFGMPHQLLVLTDLSRTLREEERNAWQRLLRVLGHELNNSLAPIKSVSTSMADMLKGESKLSEFRDDMRNGLQVISSRADSLARFVESYSKLARLPQPHFASVDVGDLISQVCNLETRLPIRVAVGPPTTIRADRAQLEQVLINLTRNAVEASLETKGSVEVRWARNGARLEISIVDGGHGVTNDANLFVPFFTTKPKGSGIGLVLSRQIAEAHGGTLSLENRAKNRSCIARLTLPL